MDVFITTNYERRMFLETTKASLRYMGFNVKIINKPMLERYFECERLSNTSIYIISDDDVIPDSKDSISKLAVKLFEHPELSQLGLAWQKDLNLSNNSWFHGKLDEDIWEADHVGGIVAIRKGTIKDLGYKIDFKNGVGDDKIVGKTARELGYKVGLWTGSYFTHLGQGKSTVWQS